MKSPTTAEEDLQLADKHVAEAEQLLANQRELICQIERDGDDPTDARRLLNKIKELQAMRIADRDRLLLRKAAHRDNPN